MRILLLRNIGVSSKTLDMAIRKLKADYDKSGINFSYEYEDVILDLKWVKYNPEIYPNSLGLDFSIIRKISKRIKSENGIKYDMICICIDQNDWEIGDPLSGWNLGEFFNGMQIQIIKVSSVQSSYVVLAQEIMHTFDQFAWLENKINLAQLLNVKDFDKDIVHKYQFEYIPWYKKINTIMNLTFEKRAKRYEKVQLQLKIITLLQNLVRLYKMIILKRKSKKVVLKN